MAKIVPLISAGAARPIVNWMAQQQLPVADMLSSFDLGWFPMDQPTRPIPLIPAVGLLKHLADTHGPDTPCRIAADAGIFGIGMLGHMALSARTIREGLQNIAASMRRHCTHEILTVTNLGGDCIVSDLWATPLQDEAAIHYIQQYVAAIVLSFVTLPRFTGPHIAHLRMRSHPSAGLAHLAPWFGSDLESTSEGTLRLVIPASVANLPVPEAVRSIDRVDMERDWPSLRQEGTLTESVRHLVRSMIPVDVPSIDRIATYAGMSRRTMQRQLSSEGETYFRILDEERRTLALEQLGSDRFNLGGLSSELGYSTQGTLTRAFRRWTGMPPSRFSEGGASDDEQKD